MFVKDLTASTGQNDLIFGIELQHDEIFSTLEQIISSTVISHTQLPYGILCHMQHSWHPLWTGQAKIGIFCFSTKHAALRRKSKDWLARNQDEVSE
jgi:hypothetical protein